LRIIKEIIGGVYKLKNKSIKVMILGLSFILAGIYIQNEPGLSQSTQGKEFFIVLLGFIFVLFGFCIHD